MCGGSAVPRALMEAFEDQFGVRMLQGWGMTETSPLAAVSLPTAGRRARHHRGDGLAGAHRAHLAGVELRIVDDDGAVLPWDGEAVGEIEVRGPWITGSYYGDPAPEKFDDGWLRTGDIASVTPNGYIKITDRSKDVIKSGGEWISSVELEGHLMAHPGVVEAAVIAVPDPRWDERPLACVVVHEATPTLTAARAARVPRRRSIAKWQLPERWTFIDEVPKTSVGKFDKKVLRAQYADGELAVEELRVTRVAARRRDDHDARRLGLRTSRRRPLAARPRVRVLALLAGALIGRVLGVRRSFAATLLSGHHRLGRRRGGVAADRGRRASRVRRLRPQPLPLLAARHDGGGGVDRVPRPSGDRGPRRRPACSRCRIRCARSAGAGRRVQRYAEITRIAVRNGLGPSLGLGRKDDVEAAGGRPPVRRLRLALEECGGMFVKLGQVLSTRTDLLSPRGRRGARRCSRTTCAPAPRDGIAEVLEEELDAPVERGVPRASTGSRSRRRRSARCTGRSCPTGRPSS